MSSPLLPRAPHPRRSFTGPDLSVHLEPRVGTSALVVLSGEMDLSGVPALRQALARAGSMRILVDVSGVTFMDCAGLGVLADAASVASATGGSLRLVGTTGSVRRLIAMTGLEARLPSYDSTTLAAAP